MVSYFLGCLPIVQRYLKASSPKNNKYYGLAHRMMIFLRIFQSWVQYGTVYSHLRSSLSKGFLRTPRTCNCGRLLLPCNRLRLRAGGRPAIVPRAGGPVHRVVRVPRRCKCGGFVVDAIDPTLKLEGTVFLVPINSTWLKQIGLKLDSTRKLEDA